MLRKNKSETQKDTAFVSGQKSKRKGGVFHLIVFGTILGIIVFCSEEKTKTWYYQEFLEKWSYDPKLKLPLRKLAEAGNPLAQEEVGLIYEEGDGVRRSNEEAAYWYELSSQNGNLNANIRLANLLYLSDKNRAFWLVKKAAESGYIDAMATLAQIYKEGILTKPDIIKSKKWQIQWLVNYKYQPRYVWSYDECLQKTFAESKKGETDALWLIRKFNLQDTE